MMAGLFLNLVGTLAKLSQGMALFGKGFITGGPAGAFKALTQSSKYLSLAEIDAAMAAQQLSGASQVLNTTLIEQVGTANAAAAAIANLTKAYSAMIATQGAASALPSFGVAGAAGKNAKTSGISIRRLKRNSGGGVPGSGNTDTVPAMLTPGEFVINKEATKQNLGLLKSINDGKTQKFNKGGIVDEIAAVLGLGFGGKGKVASAALGSKSGISQMFKNLTQRTHFGKKESISSIKELNAITKNSTSSKVEIARRLIDGGVPVSKLTDDWIVFPTSINQAARSNTTSPMSISSAIEELIAKKGSVAFSQRNKVSAFKTINPDVTPSSFVEKMTKELSDYQKKHGDVAITDDILTLARDRAYPNMIGAGAGTGMRLPTKGEIGKLAGVDVNSPDFVKAVNEYFKLNGIPLESGVVAREGKAAWWALHVLDAPGGARTGIKNKFASSTGFNSGGVVPGSGSSDTIPAMLTPGEFVVNKKAASQNQNLLQMMNGGQVKGYAEGGLIGKAAGAAPGALGFAGFMVGQEVASKAGVDNQMAQLAAGLAAQSAATSISKKALLRFGLITEEAAGKTGMLSKTLLKVGLTSTKLIPVIGWVITAGLTIKALNDSLIKAENAGGELSKAMYGSADRVRKMGEAFGRESFSTKAAKLSAERVAGPISQEAKQASSQYMGSESGKQLLADIELVKKQGGDAVTSLRNQLAQSVIAGVITPEEAKAIAVDIGTAMNDQSITLNTTADLNTLLGPNGENLLKDPLKIVADISPKIDVGTISAQASKAYEDLNPFQKITAMFKNQDLSGKDFEKQFSLKKISDENAAALENEAQARGLLNYEYQSGSITLEEYIGKLKGLQDLSNKNANLSGNAQASILGYKDTKTMSDAAIAYNSKANETKVVGGKGGVATVKISQEGKDASDAFKQSEKNAKEFINTLGLAPEVVKSITTSLQDLSKTDPTVFDKFMSGQYQSQNLEFTLRLSKDGLSPEKLDEMNMQLGILQNFPNVNKLINIQNKALTAKDIQEVYDNYVAFDKNPDIFKGINVKDNFMGPLKQAGVAWAEFAAMPNETKYAILTYVTVRQDITSGKSGEFHGGQDMAAVQKQIDDLKAAGNAAAEAFNGAFSPENTGSGSGKQSLQDYLKEFRKLTQEKQKYLTETLKYLGTAKMEAVALIDQKRYLEAVAMTESKSNKVRKEGKKILAELIKLAEQQMDIQRATAFLALSSEEKALLSLEMQGKALDNNSSKQEKALRSKERELELNNRALEDLAEKEDAVNKTYDTRLEALDNVSKTNDRLAEQDRSRIDLASALASGDIAAAANAANQMQQQSAQYQIEDTKAALEVQRKKDLESLTVSVNGKLMTRNQLEEANKNIGTQIQTIQDGLYKIETERLTLAEKRAATELRIYLLQQKQTIEALKAQKKLTDTQKAQLATLVTDFQNLAGTSYAQYKQYGGPIAKMAFGSTVPGIGMTDKVPAMLTPGEFVVRKPVADKHRSFLDSLNGQVFPGLGGRKAPSNNFLDGIGSPKYSIPQNSVSDIPISNTSVVSSSAPMYNSTYNVNVNVSGTNASPDDIANVVMAKLSQQNRGNLRSNRY